MHSPAGNIRILQRFIITLWILIWDFQTKAEFPAFWWLLKSENNKMLTATAIWHYTIVIETKQLAPLLGLCMNL